jgi:hypothetical protein
VAIRREKHTDMVGTAMEIMPDWLVLRPKEINALLNSDKRDGFQRDYVFEREFNVRDALGEHRLIPGKPFIFNDAVFAVFRRRDVPMRDPAG